MPKRQELAADRTAFVVEDSAPVPADMDDNKAALLSLLLLLLLSLLLFISGLVEMVGAAVDRPIINTNRLTITIMKFNENICVVDVVFSVVL